MTEIDKNLKNDVCIGCGVCTVNGNFKVKFNQFGEYKAERINLTDLNSLEDRICPFSSKAKNEDDISSLNFQKLIKKDPYIGNYIGVYAGSAKNNIRVESSSGGLATSMALNLMNKGLIEEVYHIEPTNNSEKLFKFSMSNNQEDIIKKCKSRYYPVTYSDVIETLKKSNKKKLIIGLPCFIKAINLLQIESPDSVKNIKFKFAILCGHLKGKFFQQMLIQDMGLKIDEVTGIDFRHKDKLHSANKYFVKANVAEKSKIKGPINLFYGQDWGMGYFKYKACDYCDDVAGETADMSFGDAWLPKYSNDPKGTNIVISRNKILDKILKEDIKKLDKLDPKDFVNSQLASFKHRRNGLQARLKNNPIIKKRAIKTIEGDENTDSIYLFRERIRDVSKKFFLFSKNVKSFLLFKLLMYPFETYYFFLKTRSLKAFIPVTIKAKLTYFFRKK